MKIGYIYAGALALLLLSKKKEKNTPMITGNNALYISNLHPSAKKIFSDFVTEVEERTGGKIIITSGYRDFKKQQQLNQQNSKNAKAGKSKHNYGLAIDLNFITKNGKHLKKASTVKEWENSGIVDISNKYGLRWGGHFKTYHDPVHFEIKNPSTDYLYQLALNKWGNNLVNMQGNTLVFS